MNETNKYNRRASDSSPSKWNIDIIKGGIAESLIKQLFSQLGYEVHYLGMEHALPAITGKVRDNSCEAATFIRKLPDFVIRDPSRHNKLFLIEIKFRANKDASNLLENNDKYPYDCAYIILVSTDSISCIKVSEYKKLKKPTINDFKMLYEYGHEFERFNKEMIIKFRNLLKNIFANINDWRYDE